MKLPTSARFSTICLHAGQEPDPSTGAIITPIYQTSTYVQDALGQHKGYEYARTQNPTRAALEGNLAAIEGGRAAFAFASGMSAISAITARLETGDHVIVTDNTYGGTFRLFDKVLTRYGITFSYVDTADLVATKQAFTPQTKLVFVETPTNPVLRLTDLAATATLAHARGAALVVDNTFASPVLQRPIEHGADMVVHSTTKYLNGHSDSIGGCVVAVRDEDIEWLRFIQNSAGAILSPFGLPDHPQYDLARRQMPDGVGGMLSFEVASFAEARLVLNRFRLMSLAESLGGVETLVCHPASMTHASVPPERRQAIGLSDALIRISAGIEDIADLKDDLAQALG
jgi:cystathionine beta-lyase/cystathionine gamma-synthase